MELFRKGPVEIVTLGLGEDGHIASLFPPLNDLAFGEKLVIHTQTDRFAVKDRISVTMHLLQDARSHIFFLKGAGKKKVWDEMMGSDEEEQRWPAKAILELERSTVVGMW
jgi:6-phosphogluconolactonase/glucosamine-6-phosphate isomerase/deaminase